MGENGIMHLFAEIEPKLNTFMEEVKPSAEKLFTEVEPILLDFAKNNTNAAMQLLRGALFSEVEPNSEELSQEAEPSIENLFSEDEPNTEESSQEAEPSIENLFSEDEPNAEDLSNEAEPSIENLFSGDQPNAEDLSNKAEPTIENLLNMDTLLDELETPSDIDYLKVDESEVKPSAEDSSDDDLTDYIKALAEIQNVDGGIINY